MNDNDIPNDQGENRCQAVAGNGEGKVPTTAPDITEASPGSDLAAGTVPGRSLCDVNGLRWHRLSAISVGNEDVEVMAATCIDGIGVIVRWVWFDKWMVEAIDTESCQWEPVDQSEEGNEIPPQPPTVWDDISANSVLDSSGLSNTGDQQERNS